MVCAPPSSQYTIRYLSVWVLDEMTWCVPPSPSQYTIWYLSVWVLDEMADGWHHLLSRLEGRGRGLVAAEVRQRPGDVPEVVKLCG